MKRPTRLREQASILWGLMAPLVFLCSVNLACSGPKKVPAQPFDLGLTPDAGMGDTGASSDAGGSDAGVSDGSDPGDAAAGDIGANDTGASDGPVMGDTGGVDAADGGQPVDLGGGDAGQLADVGPDTGVGDDGVDAGVPDQGVDAGSPLPSAYTPNTIDATFRHGQQIELIDINGDNRLDVVAAISLTDTVRLYVNGATGFTTVSVAPNNTVVAVDTEVGDIDGDNDLDIAVVGLFQRAAPFASPGEVMWFENPGTPTGTWIRRDVVAPNFYGPLNVEMGDLDGNGQLDLVIGGIETFDMNGMPQGHGVYWLQNNAGTFTAPMPIDLSMTGVEEVLVADIDGDGVDDVVAGGQFVDVVRWYENSRLAGQVAQPTFTPHLMASLDSPMGFTLVQLDADPALELVLQHDNGAGGAVVRLDAPANPTGLWTPTVIDATFGGNQSRRLVAHGDLNNDGLQDLAVMSFVNGLIRAYIQGPGQTFTPQTVATLTGVDGLKLGDIDGDGRDDIVVSTYDNGPMDSIIWYRSVP